jgi:hypothetical protein
MTRAAKPHADDLSRPPITGPPCEVLAYGVRSHSVALHPQRDIPVVEIPVPKHVFRVRACGSLQSRIDPEARQVMRCPCLVHDGEQPALGRRERGNTRRGNAKRPDRCGDSDQVAGEHWQQKPYKSFRTTQIRYDFRAAFLVRYRAVCASTSAARTTTPPVSCTAPRVSPCPRAEANGPAPYTFGDGT